MRFGSWLVAMTRLADYRPGPVRDIGWWFLKLLQCLTVVVGLLVLRSVAVCVYVIHNSIELLRGCVQIVVVVDPLLLLDGS